DRQIGTIDAAEFLRARMDVDELDLRIWDAEQGVALRGQLAEPAAHQHDEIGRLDAREQLRVGTDAEIAGVARMGGVEEMRAPERGGNGNPESLGKAPHRRPSRL